MFDKSEDRKHYSTRLMNPSLRQFAAFVKVARLGSFARASEALALSQPALSQSISQMELVLGAKLFRRTTRFVRLTPEGELLLPRAEAILAEVEGAMAVLRASGKAGIAHISLGTLPSFAIVFLADILRRFRKLHPATRVAVTDGTSDVLHAGVAAGQIDLAIGSRLRGYPNVSFEPVLRERFALVLRRDHPLARRRSVTWREALAQDFIAFPPGSGGHVAMQETLERAGLSLSPVMTLAQSNTVTNMVEAGVGITALPVLGCPPPAHKVLAVRPLIDPLVDREIGLLRAAGAEPNAWLATLQEIVTHCLMGSTVPGVTPHVTHRPFAAEDRGS